MNAVFEAITGKAQLPAPTVLLSFDDEYTHLLPIIRRIPGAKIFPTGDQSS